MFSLGIWTFRLGPKWQMSIRFVSFILDSYETSLYWGRSGEERGGDRTNLRTHLLSGHQFQAPVKTWTLISEAFFSAFQNASHLAPHFCHCTVKKKNTHILLANTFVFMTFLFDISTYFDIKLLSTYVRVPIINSEDIVPKSHPTLTVLYVSRTRCYDSGKRQKAFQKQWEASSTLPVLLRSFLEASRGIHVPPKRLQKLPKPLWEAFQKRQNRCCPTISMEVIHAIAFNSNID